MKHVIIILSITFIFNCSKSNTGSDNREGLKTILLQNWLNGSVSDQYNNGSILYAKKADLVNLSYIGNCYDTFTLYSITVSPSTYYKTKAGGSSGQYNNDYEKWGISTSNCATIGFSPANNTSFGSSTQRPDPDDGFTFKRYSCDPNNNSCPSALMKALGFSGF